MINQLRKEKPLIVCITNDVVKPFTANSLLALGASPIMSGEKSEAEDLLKHAGALLINIGTCSEEKIILYKEMAYYANHYNIPVVLDPVGYGASEFRKNLVDMLLRDYEISLVKGNAGEILSLSGQEAVTKGVDSIIEGNTLEIAKAAYARLNVPVLVTGETDAYVSGENRITLRNGHKFQGFITGSGCVLGAVIGAFLAVDNSDKSIVKATGTYNIAAENAAQGAAGPGKFTTQLIDALYQFDESDYDKESVTYHE